MRKVSLTLFLCLANFVVSHAQAVQAPYPYIEVVGTAKREIDPNQIYISISISEKSIDNRKYSIEAQESKLLQILTDMDIPKSKLVLADFSSSVIIQKRKEVGFKQIKEFNLILESGPQVSKFFDKLFDANIKEAEIFKIDHTDIVAYNKEVRIEALKAAKAKAEYLVNAVGNKLGKPLEIVEEDNSAVLFRQNAFANSYNKESVSESDFKKIVISFSYRVKYTVE